jgi:hypothetical protein
LRSNEEDVGDVQVYRPAGWSLPPARGRIGFTIEPDEVLIYQGIAATDGTLELRGSWRWEPPSRLTFELEGGRHVLGFELVDSDPERLRLRQLA